MGLKGKSQYPRASRYKDVRGKWRWRYREKGRTVQLGTEYGSDEFIRRYEDAERGKPIAASRTRPGSVDALAVEYFNSAKYKKLGQSTRQNYQGIINRFRASKTDNGTLRGTLLVKDLRQSSIIKIMGKMSDRPAAANNVRRVLKMLMKLALQLEWIRTDPTVGVEKFPEGPGHYTWTEDDIAKFYRHHKLGTVPHTAMSLMLWTGAARVDAVRLGWGNVKDGRLTYRRQKMESRKPVQIDIRITPELQEVLGTLPRDAFTFLETRQGKARTMAGLGTSMRKWCDAADLPDCTSHGLRKAIARRLAESGATTSQIAAVTGHRTLEEVAHYTEAANRADLADAGFDHLTRTKPGSNVANMSEMLAKRIDKSD